VPAAASEAVARVCLLRQGSPRARARCRRLCTRAVRGGPGDRQVVRRCRDHDEVVFTPNTHRRAEPVARILHERHDRATRSPGSTHANLLTWPNLVRLPPAGPSPAEGWPRPTRHSGRYPVPALLAVTGASQRDRRSCAHGRTLVATDHRTGPDPSRRGTSSTTQRSRQTSPPSTPPPPPALPRPVRPQCSTRRRIGGLAGKCGAVGYDHGTRPPGQSAARGSRRRRARTYGGPPRGPHGAERST